MANIFLDTNTFFDISERNIKKCEMLEGQSVFVSALSYHILFYAYKHTVPQALNAKHKSEFNIVDFTDEILNLALEGPTADLEDNLQLHSAARSDCHIFLTSDRKLLKMKFFGKVRITLEI